VQQNPAGRLVDFDEELASADPYFPNPEEIVIRNSSGVLLREALETLPCPRAKPSFFAKSMGCPTNRFRLSWEFRPARSCRGNRARGPNFASPLPISQAISGSEKEK
jgi:hypothetical protein